MPRLFDPQPVEQLGLGMTLSVGASVGNGLLGMFLLKRGKALSSPALRADGMHVLSDVVTTAGVVVGILLAKATGFWILDPLLACVVALQIIRVGWKLVRESVDALMDSTVSEETRRTLDALTHEVARRGAGAVGNLKARHAGPTLFVEVDLLVAPATSVADAHALCDQMEAAVDKAFPGSHTVVHVEPGATPDA